MTFFAFFDGRVFRDEMETTRRSNKLGRRATIQKIGKIILLLLMLMAVLSPLLQLHSCDRFPVSSDDIEDEIMYCLCSLGMVLVLTQVLKLIRALARIILPFVLPNCCEGEFFTVTDSLSRRLPTVLAVPLRI
jgi:hypothetical protein